MSSKFQLEIYDQFLLIRDAGMRTDLMSAVEGTRRIAEAVMKYNKKFVLLDYREVHYNVPLTEAYNLVKVYENKVPVYREISLAAVVDRRDWEIAKFWESICLKRGYSFKLFDDYEEAQSWILANTGNRSITL